jgi:hypothetical protein
MRYDFPGPLGLSEAGAWMTKDPDLAAINRKARFVLLHPNGIRLLWSVRPGPQDRRLVREKWELLMPKGRVEHVQDGDHDQEEGYNGGE